MAQKLYKRRNQPATIALFAKGQPPPRKLVAAAFDHICDTKLTAKNHALEPGYIAISVRKRDSEALTAAWLAIA
jgi:hypothetical protein